MFVYGDTILTDVISDVIVRYVETLSPRYSILYIGSTQRLLR